MHRHAWRRVLSFRSETTLKRSEEFLPRRCSQRLRGGMSVCANDHRSLLDLLGIVRLDDINHIEAPQGRVAVLPANARTFTFNFRGNGLRQLLELVGFSEGLRRKSTQNHIRGHSIPPCGHQRSCFRDHQRLHPRVGGSHVPEDSSDGNRPSIAGTGATRLPVLRKNPSACQTRRGKISAGGLV